MGPWFGSTNASDFPGGLAVDCNFNVYVSGVFNFNDQIVLLKYDPNGTILWQAFFDPGIITGSLVMSMHSGRIYIAAPVGSNIGVVCFDDNGTRLWDFQTNAHPDGFDFPIGISSDKDSVWVAGRMGAIFGSSDFGLIRFGSGGRVTISNRSR